MYLLIDCNNFFASCEQIFNPALRNIPVVVLSNNDGCVIARSKEAKELGIPMGAPAFQYKNLFLTKNVAVFSSNFTLYADMSQRIMDILASLGFDFEIYSIDEAFLYVPCSNDYLKLANTIRNQIKQWTGITVSVGIAPTKTLAKAANKLAKNATGVFLIDKPQNNHPQLAKFPLEDVWGIGKKTAEKLHQFGLYFVPDLLAKPDHWIKKHLKVTGLRTILELRGKSCLELKEDTPQKSIIRSRSFGTEITTLKNLEEAIASFAASIGKKLRTHRLKTSNLCIFITSNRFKKSPYFSDSVHIHLPEASSDTSYLINQSKIILHKIFQENISYKRAGVMAYELSSETALQKDLFHLSNTMTTQKEHLSKVVDQINHRFGSNTMYFAAEGIKKTWQGKPLSRSKQYTTSWNDIPRIILKNS